MRATLEEDKKNINVLKEKIIKNIAKAKLNKYDMLHYTIDGYKFNKNVVDSVRMYFTNEEQYIVSINELNKYTYDLLIRWR